MAEQGALSWQNSKLRSSAADLKDCSAACSALEHIANRYAGFSARLRQMLEPLHSTFRRPHDDEECQRFLKDIVPLQFASFCSAAPLTNAPAQRQTALQYLKALCEVAASWLRGLTAWTPAAAAAVALLRDYCRCYFGENSSIAGVVRHLDVGKRLLALLGAPDGALQSLAKLIVVLKDDSPTEKAQLKQGIVSVSLLMRRVVTICPVPQKGSVPPAAEATQAVYQALCSRVLQLSDKVRIALLDGVVTFDHNAFAGSSLVRILYRERY